MTAAGGGGGEKKAARVERELQQGVFWQRFEQRSGGVGAEAKRKRERLWLFGRKNSVITRMTKNVCDG